MFIQDIIIIIYTLYLKVVLFQIMSNICPNFLITTIISNIFVPECNSILLELDNSPNNDLVNYNYAKN